MDPSSSAYHHHGQTPSTSTYEGRISPVSDLPRRPSEVARLSYALPSSSRHTGDDGNPVLDEKYGISNRGNSKLSPPLQLGTSVSSAGGTSFMTGGTIDTVDLEKGAIEHQRQLSESRRGSKGKAKVKQEMAESRQQSHPSPRRYGSGHILPYDQQSVRSDVDEEQDMVEQRHLLESKALNILLLLSGPCAALSFLLAFYSILATLAIFFTSPLRLCTKPRQSMWEQLLATLTSAQRLQLRCIYAQVANIQGKSVASLLFNLMVSPFLSIGVALAAWTVAIYWVFAAIVGDPDGTEGGNDGVATVLGLREYWKTWLSRAIAGP